MHIFVMILKLLASTAFLVFAWKMGAFDSPYGRLIFLGLSLSWVGDVLLISESKKAFLAGLASFLLAHVAYGAAFWSRGQEGSWGILAACAAVLGAAIVGRWLMPHVGPGMRLPVLAYLAAISAMVVLAAGAAAKTASPLIFLGAAMFYVSDIAVARDKFVAPGRINRVWGLPLYYAAQFVLAATVS